MTTYTTCPGHPHLWAAVTHVFEHQPIRAYRIERGPDGGLSTETIGEISLAEKAKALLAFRREENREFDGRTYLRPGWATALVADKAARRPSVRY